MTETRLDYKLQDGAKAGVKYYNVDRYKRGEGNSRYRMYCADILMKIVCTREIFITRWWFKQSRVWTADLDTLLTSIKAHCPIQWRSAVDIRYLASLFCSPVGTMEGVGVAVQYKRKFISLQKCFHLCWLAYAGSVHCSSTPDEGTTITVPSKLIELHSRK